MSAVRVLQRDEYPAFPPDPSALVVRVPLDRIDPHRHNPRKDLVDIEALANNILMFGLLQPVVARRVGTRYELLAGHRRVAGYRLLRSRHPDAWSSIPTLVRDDDDETADAVLISSQVHTQAWTPHQEAAVLEHLAQRGLSLKEIGELLGKTESWASKRCRLYCDSVVSGYVQAGRLPAATAEELLPIRDTAQRHDLAERASQSGWSQSEARGEVRKLRVEWQLREFRRLARQLIGGLSGVESYQLDDETRHELLALQVRIAEVCG